MRLVDRDHYVADGYEPVRKSLPRIDGVVVDGETLPVDLVDFSGERPIRKRTRAKGAR